MLARAVVVRAHRDKLRVVAHVTSAGDFRAALDAGVDHITHLPANNVTSAADAHLFTLTSLDAERAARAGVVVTPTASLNQAQQRDPARAALVRQHQSASLQMLKTAGVRIAIGTDNVEDLGSGEFHYLASLGVFTNAELLRAWSEITAEAIFPTRRLGRIMPGYEASFIVLARDPLADLKATGEIVRRFKQGVEIP